MRFILRYWFAGIAMHAILTRKGGYDSDTGLVGVEKEELAYEAFKYGDAMLVEEYRRMA